MLPSVEPGYLLQALPEEAPERPEDWTEVLKDFDQTIMPGVSVSIKNWKFLLLVEFIFTRLPSEGFFFY